MIIFSDFRDPIFNSEKLEDPEHISTALILQRYEDTVVGNIATMNSREVKTMKN